MTVTEGRPNGQLRNNEIFQAYLSNDPNVGRGLITAKIFEVRSCPDDGRASHEERHQLATGETFISHEWLLDPAQKAQSELVPIKSPRKVSDLLVELVPLEVQSHAEIPLPAWSVWHAEVVADNGASAKG